MPRQSVKPPPSLADFCEPKPYNPSAAKNWEVIGKWQREGLIRVEAVTRKTARISLTTAGKNRLLKTELGKEKSA